MNLEKMKQLEDIRTEHKKISAEHSKVFSSKKENLFKKAIDDFSDYFQTRGFTVLNQLPEMFASYKDLKVALKFPNATDTFVGSYSVIGLSISNPNKNYRITVNEIGVYPRSAPIENTYSSGAKDKIDETDKEINRLTNEIKSMKANAESFKKSKLGFTLLNDDKKKAIDKQFESLKELLAEVFK